MAADSSHAQKVKPQVAPIRRIVTGHDANGQAVVIADEACPHVESIMGFPNFAVTELWTTSVPADNQGNDDPVTLPHRIPPPESGVVFRVVEFPPDKDFRKALRPDQVLLEDSKPTNGNQMMHRTVSIDFAIVLSGEIYGVLDKGEVLMKAGDTMVQRGTNHDWQNRSDAPARVAFVLVDAKPLAGLGRH